MEVDTNPRVKFYLENVANPWKFLESLNKDDAIKGGLFITTPWLTYGLILGYIFFVCLIGPAFMKNREPFKLKNVIRFYNLAEMFLAASLFYRVNEAIESPLTFFQPSKVFNLTDGCADKLFGMCNFILFVRTSEFLDTIFFTLRKKSNQITFLHVYHHAFVPFYAYWVFRYAPTRYNVFILYMNSFVHIIMYFYYFLATFQESRQSQTPNSNGQARNYKRRSFIQTQIEYLLKFKKYMTLLQISQFIILTFYSIWPIVFNPFKSLVPGIFIAANLYVALSFLGLFLQFYLSIYKKPVSSAAKNL